MAEERDLLKLILVHLDPNAGRGAEAPERTHTFGGTCPVR